MYLLFLDESGAPDEDVFAVGGVLVRADRWPELLGRWNGCLEVQHWPLDREVKWSDARNGALPPEIADAVYDCIPNLPLEVMVTVLYPNTGRAEGTYDQFFGTPEDTYATALMFLAERYQKHLENEDSHGVIVLDSRRREVDDRMRRLFLMMQREGTPFTELDRIVDGLLLGPSHFSLGLQLADLVVSCIRAARIGLGESSRWFKGLEPALARHPATGEVEGVGIKVFPDSGRDPKARLFDP
jgi:hypothetical protein